MSLEWKTGLLFHMLSQMKWIPDLVYSSSAWFFVMLYPFSAGLVQNFPCKIQYFLNSFFPHHFSFEVLTQRKGKKLTANCDLAQNLQKFWQPNNLNKLPYFFFRLKLHFHTFPDSVWALPSHCVLFKSSTVRLAYIICFKVALLNFVRAHSLKFEQLILHCQSLARTNDFSCSLHIEQTSQKSWYN